MKLLEHDDQAIIDNFIVKRTPALGLEALDTLKWERITARHL